MTVPPKIRKQRKDKRKQFLLYMDPDLILRIKHAALSQNSKAYLLVEEAVRGAIDDIERRPPAPIEDDLPDPTFPALS